MKKKQEAGRGEGTHHLRIRLRGVGTSGVANRSLEQKEYSRKQECKKSGALPKRRVRGFYWGKKRPVGGCDGFTLLH